MNTTTESFGPLPVPRVITLRNEAGNCCKRIGKTQLSMHTLPTHGERIIDSGGTYWRVCMEGGFRLRAVDSSACHPKFLHGPMMASEFGWWWNNQLA